MAGCSNVRHTVLGYEAAGVSGIQLEDQEMPKKCGHTPGRRVIPAEEMALKIRVAAEARRDPELPSIVARTDSRTTLGLEEAIRRGRIYAEAGADIIFIEKPGERGGDAGVSAAPSTKPLLANMVEGGRTPILPGRRGWPEIRLRHGDLSRRSASSPPRRRWRRPTPISRPPATAPPAIGESYGFLAG